MGELARLARAAQEIFEALELVEDDEIWAKRFDRHSRKHLSKRPDQPIPALGHVLVERVGRTSELAAQVLPVALKMRLLVQQCAEPPRARRQS